MIKKITFFLLEIILAATLIAILVSLGINKYNDMFNELPEYTVTFKDINGLTLGSPVRFSGVHVGHIIKQELHDGSIAITFKIIDRTLEIPKGTKAGIESAGLGGAKSLELKPPEITIKEGEILEPVAPTRISSLLELANVIARATLDFSKGLFVFLDQNAGDAENKVKEIGKTIQEKTVVLDEYKKKIEEKTPVITDEVKKITDNVKGAAKGVSDVQETVSEIMTQVDVKESMETIKNTTDNISNAVKSGEAERKIKEINESVEAFNKNIKKVNKKVAKMKDRELKYINEFNDNIKTMSDKMKKFADSIEKN